MKLRHEVRYVGLWWYCPGCRAVSLSSGLTDKGRLAALDQLTDYAELFPVTVVSDFDH